MLIAMTFNTGIFLAVIFGFALGGAVFGGLLAALNREGDDETSAKFCC